MDHSLGALLVPREVVGDEKLDLNAQVFFESGPDAERNSELVAGHNALLSVTYDLSGRPRSQWKRMFIELPPPVPSSSHSFYAMYNVCKFLCGRSRLSDVCFVVGNNNNAQKQGQLFYAHRLVLASSSNVWKHLLYNPTLLRYHMLLDSRFQDAFIGKSSFAQIKIPYFSPYCKLVVRLPHIAPDLFALALRYMYSDFGASKDHNVLVHDDELPQQYEQPPDKFVTLVNFALKFNIECMFNALSSRLLGVANEELQHLVLSSVNLYDQNDTVETVDLLHSFGKYVYKKSIPNDLGVTADFDLQAEYFKQVNEVDDEASANKVQNKVLKTASMQEMLLTYFRGHSEALQQSRSHTKPRPHPQNMLKNSANTDLMALFGSNSPDLCGLTLKRFYSHLNITSSMVSNIQVTDEADREFINIIDSLTGGQIVPRNEVNDLGALQKLLQLPGNDLLGCAWSHICSWLSDSRLVMSVSSRFHFICRWATRQVFTYMYTRFGSNSQWYATLYGLDAQSPSKEFCRAFLYDSCLLRGIALTANNADCFLQNINVDQTDFSSYVLSVTFEHSPPTQWSMSDTNSQTTQKLMFNHTTFFRLLHAILKPCLFLIDFTQFTFMEAEQLLVSTGILTYAQLFAARAGGELPRLLQSLNSTNTVSVLVHASTSYGWLPPASRLVDVGTDLTVPELSNYVQSNVAILPFAFGGDRRDRNSVDAGDLPYHHVFADNVMRPLRLKQPTVLRHQQKKTLTGSQTPFLSSWRVYHSDSHGLRSGIAIINDWAFHGENTAPVQMYPFNSFQELYGANLHDIFIDNSAHGLISREPSLGSLKPGLDSHPRALEKLRRMWNEDARASAGVMTQINNDSQIEHFCQKLVNTSDFRRDSFRSVQEFTYDNSTQQLYVTVGIDPVVDNNKYHSITSLYTQNEREREDSFSFSNEHDRRRRLEVDKMQQGASFQEYARQEDVPSDFMPVKSIGKLTLSDEESFKLIMHQLDPEGLVKVESAMITEPVLESVHEIYSPDTSLIRQHEIYGDSSDEEMSFPPPRDTRRIRRSQEYPRLTNRVLLTPKPRRPRSSNTSPLYAALTVKPQSPNEPTFYTVPGLICGQNSDLLHAQYILPFFPNIKPLSITRPWDLTDVHHKHDALGMLKLLYTAYANHTDHTLQSGMMKMTATMHNNNSSSSKGISCSTFSNANTPKNPLNVPMLALLSHIPCQTEVTSSVHQFLLHSMDTAKTERPVKPEVVACINTLSLALTDVTAACHSLLRQMLTTDIPNVAALLLGSYGDLIKRRMQYEMGIRGESSNSDLQNQASEVGEATVEPQYMSQTASVAEIHDFLKTVRHSYTVSSCTGDHNNKNNMIPSLVTSRNVPAQTKPDSDINTAKSLLQQENNVENDVDEFQLEFDIWEEVPHEEVGDTIVAVDNVNNDDIVVTSPTHVRPNPNIAIVPPNSDALYPDEGGMWSCHSCTMENIATVTQCHVCEASRFLHNYIPPFEVRRRDEEANRERLMLHVGRSQAHLHNIQTSVIEKAVISRYLTEKAEREKVKAQMQVQEMLRMQLQTLLPDVDMVALTNPLAYIELDMIPGDLVRGFLFKAMRVMFNASKLKDIPLDTRKDQQSMLEVYLVRINLLLGKQWLVHDLTSRMLGIMKKTSIFADKERSLGALSVFQCSVQADEETQLVQKQCSALLNTFQLYSEQNTANLQFRDHRHHVPVRSQRKFTGRGIRVDIPRRIAVRAFKVQTKGCTDDQISEKLLLKRGVRAVYTPEQTNLRRLVKGCVLKLRSVGGLRLASQLADAKLSVVVPSRSDFIRSSALQLQDTSKTKSDMPDQVVDSLLTNPVQALKAFDVMPHGSSSTSERDHAVSVGVVVHPDEKDVNMISSQLAAPVTVFADAADVGTHVTDAIVHTVKHMHAGYAKRALSKFNRVLRLVQSDMRHMNTLFQSQVSGQLQLPVEMDWVDMLTQPRNATSKSNALKTKPVFSNSTSTDAPITITDTFAVKCADVADDQSYEVLFPYGDVAFHNATSNSIHVASTSQSTSPVIPKHLRGVVHLDGPLGQLGTRVNPCDPPKFVPLRHHIMSIPVFKSYFEKVFLYSRQVCSREVMHMQLARSTASFGVLKHLLDFPFDVNISMRFEYGVTHSIERHSMVVDITKPPVKYTKKQLEPKHNEPILKVPSLILFNDVYWFKHCEAGLMHTASMIDTAFSLDNRLHECLSPGIDNAADVRTKDNMQNLKTLSVRPDTLSTLNHSRNMLRSIVKRCHEKDDGIVNLAKLLRMSTELTCSRIILPVSRLEWKAGGLFNRVGPRQVKGKVQSYLLNAQLMMKDSVYYSVQLRRAQLMYDRLLFRLNMPSSGQSECSATHKQLDLLKYELPVRGATLVQETHRHATNMLLQQTNNTKSDEPIIKNIDLDLYYFPRSCCVERAQRHIAWAKARLLLSLEREKQGDSRGSFEAYLRSHQQSLTSAVTRILTEPAADVSKIKIQLGHIRPQNQESPSICHHCYGIGRTLRLQEAQTLAKYKGQALYAHDVNVILKEMDKDVEIKLNSSESFASQIRQVATQVPLTADAFFDYDYEFTVKDLRADISQPHFQLAQRYYCYSELKEKHGPLYRDCAADALHSREYHAQAPNVCAKDALSEHITSSNGSFDVISLLRARQLDTTCLCSKCQCVESLVHQQYIDWELSGLEACPEKLTLLQLEMYRPPPASNTVLSLQKLFRGDQSWVAVPTVCDPEVKLRADDDAMYLRSAVTCPEFAARSMVMSLARCEEVRRETWRQMCVAMPGQLVSYHDLNIFSDHDIVVPSVGLHNGSDTPTAVIEPLRPDQTIQGRAVLRTHPFFPQRVFAGNLQVSMR